MCFLWLRLLHYLQVCVAINSVQLIQINSVKIVNVTVILTMVWYFEKLLLLPTSTSSVMFCPCVYRLCVRVRNPGRQDIQVSRLYNRLPSSWAVLYSPISSHSWKSLNMVSSLYSKTLRKWSPCRQKKPINRHWTVISWIFWYS